MKKEITFYIAGIATALIVGWAISQISKHNAFAMFEVSKEQGGRIVSTFKTRDWVFAEVDYKKKKARSGSKENQARITFYELKPKDPELNYGMSLKLDEKGLKDICISDGEKRVFVAINDENDLKSAIVKGRDFLSIDKNLDGFFDQKTEVTPFETTIYFFTSEGVVKKVAGKPLSDENTGETFKMRWTEAGWEKDYGN